jgi:hypothetical protein
MLIASERRALACLHSFKIFNGVLMAKNPQDFLIEQFSGGYIQQKEFTVALG